MNVLVSAIITTHNRKDLLLKAIRSVLNQTYCNIETIVIDDASNDGTEKFLCDLGLLKDIKYVYIIKENSKGGNYARNIGINMAQGKYIAFLDDDDEWMPTKIEKQISLLENNLESRVCYCGRKIEYDHGRYTREDDIGNLPEGDLSRLIFTRLIGSTSTLFVEKELLKEIGLFDEKLKFWQEYDLCMRAFQFTQVSVVKENVVLYRVINSDTSRLTNKFNGWEETIEYLNDKYQEIINNLSYKEKCQRQVFIYNDAINRCHSSGLRKKQKYYLKKKWCMTHNFKDLLKYILNSTSARRL